jgi:hypothetical protein
MRAKASVRLFSFALSFPYHFLMCCSLALAIVPPRIPHGTWPVPPPIATRSLAALSATRGSRETARVVSEAGQLILEAGLVAWA